MPQALVKRKRASVEDLNAKELMFVKHLLADDLWRPVEAARKAGFSDPHAWASNLMRKPQICEVLGREQRRRLERLELKADEVLHIIATGIFYNPLSLFKPGKKGYWVVEDIDQIPDDIGRLIEEVETRVVEELDDDGNTRVITYFKVKMISKTELLRMAMKHCGIEGSTKIQHSGQVQVSLGLEGGIGQLLMNVESTRSNQVIDGTVLNLEEENSIKSAVNTE